MRSWWHFCSPTRAATSPGRRSPSTALHRPSPSDRLPRAVAAALSNKSVFNNKRQDGRTGRSGCGLRFQVVSGAGQTASSGELADCVDDPAPHGGAVVILLGEKLIGARSAFLERFLAVALEHQAGCAPDVDLRHHGKSELIARRHVI